jgi:alpha(1,3/1,4) fucosyltransferase
MIFGNLHCEDYSANKVFDYSNPRNSDGLFTCLIVLREKLLQFGIEVNTLDMNAGKNVSFDIHIEARPLAATNIDQYLIASENPLINPLNADGDYLKSFRRVFSWNDAALTNPGAVKVLIPNDLRVSEFRGFSERSIFSCLISSNKVHPWGGDNGLYAERINVIRWHEKNAPALFHLYGRGWGKPSAAVTRKAKLVRRIGRLRTQLFGYKPFPSWQGEVQFKTAILSNARFSYCYENVKDLPNYITEKIFDSFLSGCVPIYWGANNVQDFIPANCFVDRRHFKNTADVHRYLMSMAAQEYGQYQENISAFLKSDKAALFSVEHYATTIANTIAGDLNQIALADQ